jgi:hypothetical protein
VIGFECVKYAEEPAAPDCRVKVMELDVLFLAFFSFALIVEALRAV